MTASTINLACQRGTKKVDAEVIGPFGIHAHPEKPQLWAITHIETGRRVGSALSPEHARKAISRLSALPIDWGFSDPKTIEMWPMGVMFAIHEIRAEAVT